MPAQCLAILDRHLSFRDWLSHDLQLAAATLGAGKANPNKPETQVGYRAFNNLADPRFYHLCVRYPYLTCRPLR